MRILIVPSWYPTPRNPVSGIFVREQARALGRSHEIRVLYLDVLPRNGRQASRRWTHKEPSFTEEYIEVPNRPLVWQFAYLWRMFLALRRLRREFRPDIIHCHVAVPAGWGVAMLRRVTKTPVVMTEHSSEFKSWMKRPGLRWMARRAFAGVNVTIAVSKGQKRLIENTFPGCVPVTVVPNMVDTTLFSPTSFLSHKEGYRLLFVGLLDTDQKGLHILLDALAQITQKGILSVHLDIVGDGVLRASYESQAHTLGVEEFVTFVGIKTHADIIQLFQRCHAFVLPSLHEALPLVIIEALASGRPVISTRCGGPEFMINSSNGLIVEPGHAASLADAITHLLNNLGRYDPQAISSDASKLYSREAVTATLTEIYDTLLSADPLKRY